jgi:hypothetical protein
MVSMYGIDASQEDELESWVTTKVFDLEDENLIQYWLRQMNNKRTYRLAKLAIDMASIPAMSSDCERVFSQAKLLITGQRNNLKADIIEATQCLRMWLILGLKAENSWSGEGNWTTPMEIFNHGVLPAEVEEFEVI